MTDKTRIVVLASGRGTNLQALLDATRNDTVAASVIAVISHTPTALALERARRAGIPAHFVAPPRKLENREEWDGYLADLIEPL
jgi:phosphoribosylglycinamide formyltransferase-1